MLFTNVLKAFVRGKNEAKFAGQYVQMRAASDRRDERCYGEKTPKKERNLEDF